MLTPRTWDPGPQPLGALSCGVPPSCPALHSPSSCGIRFPAPGASSRRCSETGGGNTSERLCSPPCGQAPTRHLRRDTEETVEESDSGRLDFWRRCFWSLGCGPQFLLTWLHYQEGTLPNKDVTQKTRDGLSVSHTREGHFPVPSTASLARHIRGFTSCPVIHFAHVAGWAAPAGTHSRRPPRHLLFKPCNKAGGGAVEVQHGWAEQWGEQDPRLFLEDPAAAAPIWVGRANTRDSFQV